MNEFCLGIAVGLVITMFSYYILIKYEWKQRRKLEQRLDYLYSKLCCGKGFFGCNGGPKCNWDHK